MTSDTNEIYVPASWITAALGGISFKQAKIAKKDIRGAVFVDENQLLLKYK